MPKPLRSLKDMTHNFALSLMNMQAEVIKQQKKLRRKGKSRSQEDNDNRMDLFKMYDDIGDLLEKINNQYKYM